MARKIKERSDVAEKVKDALGQISESEMKQLNKSDRGRKIIKEIEKLKREE